MTCAIGHCHLCLPRQNHTLSFCGGESIRRQLLETFKGNLVMLDEASLLRYEHGNSIILIDRLWFTQARLKRPQQMPGLIEHAHTGGLFNGDPVIELHQNEDEEIVINNGHHRVTAVWLSGRKFLYREEFIILYKDAYRPRFGTIALFLERLPAETLEGLRQNEIVKQTLTRLAAEQQK
jgi:hypothetical protein